MARAIRIAVGFALGSVTVDITGADVERLLSRAAAAGAAFWDVRRLDAGRVRLNVGLEGYFTLRRLCRRHMCRLRTVGKRGAPFKAHRLEKRWGLLLGAALAVAAAWYLSGLVWTIGIDGGEGVSRPEVLAMLDRAGVRTGTRVRDIDPDTVRNEVLLMTDRLSFFVINLRGTHAQVTLREQAESPAVVDRATPCDVVSDKAGVVVALRVREGTALVKPGQTVAVGDVIAGGTLQSALGEVRRVHASAEADLRVWYTLERRLSDTASRLEPTGEQVRRHALALGNRRIRLYLIETEPFACYDKKVEKWALSPAGDFHLPLMLIAETYSETRRVEARVDPLEAARVLEDGLREQLALRHPGAQVLSAAFEMEHQDGVFVGRLRAECLETAGVERALE